MGRMLDEPTNRSPTPVAISMVWIGAIGLAALVHFAFLDAWPDHFIDEDSGPYLEEAQSILTGR
jgi:hypothetical protein